MVFVGFFPHDLLGVSCGVIFFFFFLFFREAKDWRLRRLVSIILIGLVGMRC